MSARVTDRDHGWRALLARAKDLGRGPSVRVGILQDAPKQEDDGKTSPYTLVEVAALHEFGAPEAHIPQRSFIRATVDLNAGAIGELQTALGVRMLRGDLPIGQGLGQLGAKVVGMVQRRMSQGIDPPLKLSTIARRPNGGTKPLVDTGQLKSSVTFQVEGA